MRLTCMLVILLATTARPEACGYRDDEDLSAGGWQGGFGSSTRFGGPFNSKATQAGIGQYLDVDAFAAESGILDLTMQTLRATGPGATRFYAKLFWSDGSGCLLWLVNPCMPFSTSVHYVPVAPGPWHFPIATTLAVTIP